METLREREREREILPWSLCCCAYAQKILILWQTISTKNVKQGEWEKKNRQNGRDILRMQELHPAKPMGISVAETEFVVLIGGELRL